MSISWGWLGRGRLMYSTCWPETMFLRQRKMNFKNIFILPNVIGDRSRRRFGGIFIKLSKVTSKRSSLMCTSYTCICTCTCTCTCMCTCACICTCTWPGPALAPASAPLPLAPRGKVKTEKFNTLPGLKSDIWFVSPAHYSWHIFSSKSLLN